MTFEELLHACRERQKEWQKGAKLSPLFRAAELGGEVGEALNVVKKLEREKLGLVGSRSSHAALGEEISDVIICACLLAEEYGLDVRREIRAKFNKTSIANGLNTRL